ncbi:uncharacterized protein LOC131852861 [Achroia grisella]|uniref:uncharacterized protein LOC131852861 n=1 Tax=Achroia grisella TaxID=688607 RepID=UPI0027D318D4|nr:uncharacterized protein LOC131852861 [Achroia grisella]
MKLFVAVVALVAVAVASPAHRPGASDEAQLAAIIAAVQSPTTDPATAALLQQQLKELFGIESVVVGPPVIEEPSSPVGVPPAPIVVGPGVIEFPELSPAPEPIVVLPPVIVGPPVVNPPVSPPVVNPPVVELPIVNPPVVVLPPVVEPPVVVLPPTPELTPEAQPESSSAPLVQIILNINQAQSGSAVGEPVQIIDIPSLLPSPVITLPAELH